MTNRPVAKFIVPDWGDKVDCIPSQRLRIKPQEAEKKDDVGGGLAGYAAYITRVWRHDRRLKGEGYVRGKEEEKMSFLSSLTKMMYCTVAHMLEREL